jgi:hypothetical protein
MSSSEAGDAAADDDDVFHANLARGWIIED